MYALDLNLSKSKNLPEGGKVSLGELKSFYESNVDIEESRKQIETKRAEVEALGENASAIPKISNELLNAKAQVLALQQVYDNTDWQGIRHTNPGEYAALMADYNQRMEVAKHQESEATKDFEGNKQKHIDYQRERLLETMPELKDEAVIRQAALDVQKFAMKFGYTANEIAAIEDHRLMRMLITASKVDKAKETVSQKKADTTPKASRPSASRPTPGRNAALKRLTEKARATGQKTDQAAVVAEMLRQS